LSAFGAAFRQDCRSEVSFTTTYQAVHGKLLANLSQTVPKYLSSDHDPFYRIPLDGHLLAFPWIPDFGLNIAAEMRSSSRESLIIFLEAANHQCAFKRGDDQICDFTLVHAGPHLSCFDALSDDRLDPLLPALERLACMITKYW